MSSPRLTGGWVHNMTGARGTCTTASIAAKGDTTMTPKGQDLRHLKEARVTCR
jgi:hypothetical protein